MNRNVTAALLIILAIGIYVTFTSSKMQEINDIKSVNAKYTLAIENATRLLEVRDKVNDDYSHLTTDDIAKMNKILPDTVDNIRLVVDLNNLADTRGLVLKGLRATVASAGKNGSASSQPSNSSSKTGPAAGSIETVTVSFGVNTTYARFISFLGDLERDMRIMDVTHLSLTANDTGSYDFGVEMKTYWISQ